MTDPVQKILSNLFEINGLICLASVQTNFSVYDFDFRQYFETRPVIAATKLPVILRTGAIAHYEELYRGLEASGLTLINSVEQHEVASLLPEWYPLIESYTAASKVYEVQPAAEEIMQDFAFPVFIKGERQTSKHQRSLCIAANKTELEHILKHWTADPILNWQRMICRQFIQLEKIDQHTGDQLPCSNEHRVFLWKNKVAAIGQYWTEARKIELSDTERNEIKALAEHVAGIVNVPFLVVDIARQEDKRWIVIELNDAQESGYAGVSRLKLWEEIISMESQAGKG